MNHIIVPTDFSNNAHKALNYAVNLANHFDSTIHLIHVYEVRSRAGMLINVRDFMQKDAEQQLSAQLQAVKKQLLPHTALKAKAVEGQAVDRICAYAKNVGAELIVMGTQGASGLKEIFVGSNTAGVIRKSEIAVLAVPNGFVYRPFKKVVLALDDQIVTTPDVLAPLIQIADTYKASVSVLHVEQPGQNSPAIDKGVDVFLDKIPHQFHTIQSDSINEGINGFVEEQEADLLCMIQRERSFIERLFHSSSTRREVFDSPVPLLILHDY